MLSITSKHRRSTINGEDHTDRSCFATSSMLTAVSLARQWYPQRVLPVHISGRDHDRRQKHGARFPRRVDRAFVSSGRRFRNWPISVRLGSLGVPFPHSQRHHCRHGCIASLHLPGCTKRLAAAQPRHLGTHLWRMQDERFSPLAGKSCMARTPNCIVQLEASNLWSAHYPVDHSLARRPPCTSFLVFGQRSAWRTCSQSCSAGKLKRCGAGASRTTCTGRRQSSACFRTASPGVEYQQPFAKLASMVGYTSTSQSAYPARRGDRAPRKVLDRDV